MREASDRAALFPERITMLFAAVVETSQRVAQTSRRLEKIDLLAALLRQLQPEEVQIVVAFLSGYTRQARIGVGYGALPDAAAAVNPVTAETPGSVFPPMTRPLPV